MLFWIDMEDFKNWIKNYAFMALLIVSAVIMIWCAIRLICEWQPRWWLATFTSTVWTVGLCRIRFKEDEEDEKEEDEETEDVKIDI